MVQSSVLIHVDYKQHLAAVPLILEFPLAQIWILTWRGMMEVSIYFLTDEIISEF